MLSCAFLLIFMVLECILSVCGSRKLATVEDRTIDDHSSAAFVEGQSLPQHQPKTSSWTLYSCTIPSYSEYHLFLLEPPLFHYGIPIAIPITNPTHESLPLTSPIIHSRPAFVLSPPPAAPAVAAELLPSSPRTLLALMNLIIGSADPVMFARISILPPQKGPSLHASIPATFF